MPKKLSGKISPRQASEAEAVIRKWLVVFGTLFQKEITPLQISAWCELLADVDAALLENACAETAKSCRFFPAPGDVRALLAQAAANSFDLKAETQWQNLLAWTQKNYFPDTGVRKNAPALPPAVEHAARAAGGLHFIESCSEEQLVWCRKNFLTAYTNVHETGQVEHLLGDDEAKQILARLLAGAAEYKQLSGASCSNTKMQHETAVEVAK